MTMDMRHMMLNSFTPLVTINALLLRRLQRLVNYNFKSRKKSK